MYGSDTSGSSERPGQVFQQPEPDAGQALPAKYKFSSEEIRVLKECNRESFYFRCLPIGTALGVGTYYAVRMGYLKPSARWGSGPKMFFASVCGYFLGKVSYQSRCAEKLMQIPNSPLADMLKKQKGKLGFQESLSMEPGFVTAAPIGRPAFPDSEYAVMTDPGPGQFTDVGDTRPLQSFDTQTSSQAFQGDEYSKYDTTQQMLNDDNLPQRRSQMFTTSYDELRKSNRDEYEHKIHSPSTKSGLPDGPRPSPTNPQQYPVRSSESPAGPRPRKNAYGDEWDDKVQ